jgi:hypothetical protein
MKSGSISNDCRNLDKLFNEVICLKMLDLEFQVYICPTVFYMMLKFNIMFFYIVMVYFM